MFEVQQQQTAVAESVVCSRNDDRLVVGGSQLPQAGTSGEHALARQISWCRPWSYLHANVANLKRTFSESGASEVHVE